MKNLLILSLFFLLVRCGSSPVPEPETGSLILHVFKQEQLASGLVIENRAKAQIRIWNAEGKDFEFKSHGDVYEMEAFDKISQTYINDYISGSNTYDGEFRFTATPGKYFVLVRLNPSEDDAYSYTTFILTDDGQRVELKKTFSFDVGDRQFEEWDKNQ